MAALAGETIIAGKVPGERIATTIRAVDSAIVTAEAVIDTVIAPVVAGRIYKTTWAGRLTSTVAGDDYSFRIREDSIAGNLLLFDLGDMAVAFRLGRLHLEVEYTADVTEDKTFVATLALSAGTGDLMGEAQPAGPTYLYVNYIRG